MRTAIAAALALLVGGWLSSPAWADGLVLGLTQGVDELELYKTPDAEEPSLTAGAGELEVPMPVLAVDRDYGMLKIRHQGADYWVISDDVKTDMTRKVDASCEPKVASTLVAHGKRGGGEECK
jgi:hypothetical protein